MAALGVALRSILALFLAAAGLLCGYLGWWATFMSSSRGMAGPATLLVPASICVLLCWGAYRLARGALRLATGAEEPGIPWKSGAAVLLIVLPVALLARRAFSPSFLAGPRGSQTKGDLGAIRSALSIYYGDMDGQYPGDLEALLARGKYLAKMPDAEATPHHGRSRAVRRMTGEEHAAGAFGDAGGWAYVVSGPSSGTVLVDCTHTDVRGTLWNAY